MKESAVKIEVNVYAIQVTKVQIAMSKSVHQLTATGTSSNHTGNVFIMGEAISAMVNANAILVEWYCLRNTDDQLRACSACDQDCSSQCLDDFPNVCTVNFNYFTQNGILNATSRDLHPTLDQLHINEDWTRKWKNDQGPEDTGIKQARVCFIGCVSECLSSCQKELQSKPDDDRDNTKMDTLVKDQLEMSGHISKDVLKDEVKKQAAEEEDSELLITNKMVQDSNSKIASQGEMEQQSTSQDAGNLDGASSQEQTVNSSATSATNMSFKAIGQKLEKSTKKVEANSQSSGILGWIGGLFGGKKK